MTFKYRYKKQIILGITISFILSFLSIYYIRNAPDKEEVESPLVLKENKKEDKIIDETEKVKVDIKGQILNPGLYEMTSSDRVSDVIASAGGLTEHADISVINLSKRLQDEMVIIIYSKQEVMNFKDTKQLEEQVINHCRKVLENELRNDACIDVNNATNSDFGGLININTASVEELMMLPGIGETRAKAIVLYREEHGSFSSIEEIKDVSGIGESVFASLKENITT